MLTMNGIEHFNPVSLFSEMKNYTIFVDGISKSLAATGVRVGWSFGPAEVISRMKSILGHVGAWSPKAEQVATTHFLNNETAVEDYLTDLKNKINARFDLIYKGFKALKNEGFPVDIISPQGAIYLSAQISIKGFQTPDGRIITTTENITSYLLNHAQLAIVPFTAFGCHSETDWYRISVGTISLEEIPMMLAQLKVALMALQPSKELV
jgi:aspartate aminotransferase